MARGAYHSYVRILTALMLGVGVGVLAGCGDSEPGSAPTPAAYVAEETCAGCHAAEADAWHGSQHDLAMQEAGPESVLGDFTGTFTYYGTTSTFSTRNGRYFVNTDGPDGELHDYEIAYTFGVEPLQQYLIEFPGGRLQALSIAWDTRAGRWFHLYPEEPITADDPLHWTGPYQNWNIMCAECHSTNFRKGYDPETRTYDTSWTATDVGCQACHGPGSDHVAWAGSGRDAAPGLGLVVDLSPGSRSSTDQIEGCAACHSRRRPVSLNDIAGEPFLDHFVPATLDEGLYYPDGQIRDEVYVYGSFLQSRMYQAGVVCADCHDPHALGTRATGNDLCLGCHDAAGPTDRFPTLHSDDYDSPAHHFHAPDSAGAQCVNCHMPSRTYMIVDPRRDHSFRIPRPDLTVTLGTPNACNDCHTDQSAEWAADAVASWYGTDRARQPHYGETIAAGQRGDPEAGAALAALAQDPETAAIIRATAVQLAARYGAETLPALSAALRDPDPLVRVTAAAALEAYPPVEQLRRLPALLRDPVRSVRLEAARLLATVPPASVRTDDRALLAELLDEYEAVQTSLSDMPGGNLNLGVLHTARGDVDRAIADYRRALEIQPDFTPASLNLATLYSQLGRSGDAYLVLRDAIAEHPEEGEIHYSMGLLLAEMGQMDNAVASLGRSAELIPERSRIRYNYGLALKAVDRRDDAENQLLEANRLDPGDPSVVQALAVLYSEDTRWNEAIDRAEELVSMRPGDTSARQFLESVRRQARTQ